VLVFHGRIDAEVGFDRDIFKGGFADDALKGEVGKGLVELFEVFFIFLANTETFAGLHRKDRGRFIDD